MSKIASFIGASHWWEKNTLTEMNTIIPTYTKRQMILNIKPSTWIYHYLGREILPLLVCGYIKILNHFEQITSATHSATISMIEED